MNIVDPVRLYHENDLGRYGILLERFLECPDILWAHLDYEAFRRDPVPMGMDYAPLLPDQRRVQQRLLMQEFEPAQTRHMARLLGF